LLWILHTLHDIFLHDWSLSIVFLVLIVRSCLHPVTKWSQIRMARFGKQMQGIAPKQKILQEKYKDDPKKLQEETGKLWREQGISPAGFLGCLPMGLQTPVWIALYASLYFSVEMRNEHAFYGVFQHIQPHSSPFWQFLGNLAEPDRFLYWGKTVVNLPLIGRWEPHLPLLGDITGLNVLPLLLAVVFFIQQKYLTPPTSATMTPEQEFQQKLMRWMTVFMFPVFMYNAPSGLAIYFICNSTFAIIESKYIRSHVAKLDAAKAVVQASGVGTSMIDRKQKKQGFMARLQEMAEEKQKEAMKQARRTGKGPRK
jgi:YidC/Oxa1 family membrane protein insertase